MRIIDDAIEDYACAHTKVTPSDVLNQLERQTHLEVMRPKMLSGYLQGQFLAFLSLMKRPKRILEVGTYTAYATLCLAEGLTEDGQLHTIDVNEEVKAIATTYIQKAGLQDKVKQYLGDAKTIIPTLEESWDLVFLDADKVHYAEYYDLIFPSLKVGGLLLADNVLWNGQVPKGSQEKRASALAKFNTKVTEDTRVRNVLLPLRDGLMLLEKIAD